MRRPDEERSLARRLPTIAVWALLPLLVVQATDGSPSRDEALGIVEVLVTFSLPLLVFGVFANFPRDAAGPIERHLARYGLDRRRLVARGLGVRTAASMLGAALLTSFAGTAVGALAPPHLGVVVLGAFALAGLCAAAAALRGRRALGVVLGLDVVFGLGPPELAVGVPSGHLRALLGLTPPLCAASLSLTLLGVVGVLGGLLATRAQPR